MVRRGTARVSIAGDDDEESDDDEEGNLDAEMEE
jgi:hypothetical protein